MSINSQLLGDFVSGLYHCQTFEEKYQLYTQYVQKLGFESCAYTFVPSAVSDTALSHPPIFIKSDEFSDSFIEQYAVDRFDERDFTLRAAKENMLFPMEWQACINTNYLTQPEKDVLILAKNEHNINHGVTIPVMNESIGIAGFSLTNALMDKNFNRLKRENLETLQLISKAFHDIVFSKPYSYHAFIPQHLLQFSDKEKIVLDFVMRGKSMADLEKSNEPVSRRYGEKLLAGVKERFGGVSTNELIRYITQLDLL